jgi:hypothetical protein
VADKIKVNIYISPDMLKILKKLAAIREVAYAELVRTACREYIVRHATQITADRDAMERAT